MKGSMKTGVLVGAALLAAAMVGMTVAEEPKEKDTLQSSWNDYPAKWINSSGIPDGPVNWGPRSGSETPTVPNDLDTPQPPETQQPPPQWIPPQTPPGGYPPGLIPPRQQQQGKPSGGFQWGGKTGGSGQFGGKQGGSFGWGKVTPPQSQQGRYPGGGQANPNQAQLMEYIRQLQKQNAELRALLERLTQNASGERSPDMPSNGTPLY